MSFPAEPLDVAVELDLGGTWTDITTYALQREGSSPPITITRGRADETSQATPSSCQMQWNNRDGRFSPRNPVGPYYGLLGRNTPVRVSVPASGTALRLEDDTVSSVSSSSVAAITGDLDARIEMNLSGWQAGSLCGAPDWYLALNGDGTISLVFGAHSVASTMPLPLGHIALRVTRASSSGVVTFYTSATISGSWTQLGLAVTGATGSMGSDAGPLGVGVQGLPASVTGRFFEFQVYAGISGTLKADAQFSAQAAGTTSWTDPQGNTWTVAGTATIDGRSYRGYFECSSLPQQWDVTGTDIWTPVTAAGVLRRIQQGNSPIASVMRRGIASWPSEPSASASSLVSPQSTLAYWPCEDAAGSTQVAAGIAVSSDGESVQPMSIAGTATFSGTAGSPSADSIFACSAQLGQPGTSIWSGAVPGYSVSATAWSVTFLLAIPSGGLSGTSFIMTAGMPGGYLSVFYTTAAGGTLSLDISGGGSVTGPAGVNGTPLMVQVSNVGTGAVTAYMTTLPLGTGAAGTQVSGGSTAGNITAVRVGPHGDNLGQTEIGHIWVSGAWSQSGTQDALPNLLTPDPAVQNLLNAWAGETAADRVARLCTETGLASRVYGYPDISAAMGPQQIDTLGNVLQSCETSDRGLIYEPAETLGLGYRTQASLCSQSPAVTLSYTAATLGGDGSAGLAPVDDDQYTINDAIVSRNNGSTVQVQVTSGAMSISAPPDGVGDYSTQVTAYVQFDAQLANVAGWVTHVGTANEERYPVIPLNLARTELAALVYEIQAVRIGDYVQVTNPPAWLPPGTISQLAYGTAERLGGFWWLLSWNAVPETPYETATAGTAHADTAGTTLHAPVASGITLLGLDTAAGGPQRWTTAASDFPFGIIVSGEQMTVTNIDGPPAGFLTGNDAGFDTGSGHWVSGTNSSVTQTTGHSHSGAGSLQVTSSAAGTMSFNSCLAGSITSLGLPCSAGDTIAVGGWFLAATAGRTCVPGAGFYTSGGSFISLLGISGAADSTAGWTKVTGTVTAPATAAFCRLTPQILSAGAGGEVHYFDDAYIADVTAGGTTQTATVTRSVNGVVKAQASGAAAALATPPIAALAGST